MMQSWLGDKHGYNYSECIGLRPTWNRYNATTKRRISNICHSLKRFIDTIHSTEIKAIKEGTTSVNSNYKSFLISW